MGQECTVCTLCFRLQPSPFSSSPHPALKSTRVPPYCAPRSPRQGDGPVMRLSGFRSFEGVSVGLPLLPRGWLGGEEGTTPPAMPPARVRLGGGEGVCVCVRVCVRARARWRAAGGREERSGRQRAEGGGGRAAVGREGERLRASAVTLGRDHTLPAPSRERAERTEPLTRRRPVRPAFPARRSSLEPVPRAAARGARAGSPLSGSILPPPGPRTLPAF